MRFLKALVTKETGTLQVVGKNANQVPQYAILSHTWEEDEVKLEDIESGRAKDVSSKALDAKAKTSPLEAKSLSKLKCACIQAANDGYEYIWIDSCCIGKRNSAELSEAINFMFAWYRDAAVCYAFLLNAPDELDTAEARAEFAENRWFRRGFTLQELLAPTHVIFFSGKWVPIGEKRLLCSLLAEITGIDADILRGDRPLTSASVARRMSWAAKRVTTRPEDTAYCLMGIFSVNMPMLYGEGAEKAFVRLQEEIMKESDDQSLFAWVTSTSPPDAIHGLLATSPSFFLHSNNIMPYQDWEPRAPYAVTNRGLGIDLHLTACDDGGGIYLAALDCPVPPDYKGSSFLALYLKKLSDSDEQYARVKVGQLASVDQRGDLKTVYVRQKPNALPANGAYPHHLIYFYRGPSLQFSRCVYRLISMLYPADSDLVPPPPLRRNPYTEWTPATWLLTLSMGRKPAQLSAALIFQCICGKLLAVMIGTMGGFDIAFNVHELDAELSSDVLTFEYMEGKFEASTANRFKREHHEVSVHSVSLIRSSFKYYIVNIHIEAAGHSFKEITEQVYNVATGSGHGDAGTLMSGVLPAAAEEPAGKADGKNKKLSLHKHL
ncbi:HET-domain-containing protein [Hypoxylon rubiginosum]|uniref:HET-domain-containing protein n=1 Tax=Hypoxylon rubiginosum TaxID=110542 RepID=A0ACB9YWE3_9PEZI|nr:HET-domain-containing protein [Hypoxylon rubiginosum]